MNILKTLGKFFKGFCKTDAAFNILSRKNYYGNENEEPEVKEAPFTDSYDNNFNEYEFYGNKKNRVSFIEVMYSDEVSEDISIDTFSEQSVYEKLNVEISSEAVSLEHEMRCIYYKCIVESDEIKQMGMIRIFLNMHSKYLRYDLFIKSGSTLGETYLKYLKNLNLLVQNYYL